MELKLDEQTLLANYRHLPPDGKKEFLDYAAFLVKKYSGQAGEPGVHPDNQCSLDEQPGKRPETAKEPIFTE
jgi:hypothetical protein